MDKRSGGLLVVMFAVMGALGVPRAPKPGPEGTSDKAPNGATPTASTPSRVREEVARERLVARFEELMAKSTGESDGLATEMGGRVSNDVVAHRNRGFSLDAVVVSVPDPRQSHLALYYGQILESLRRAFEIAGFLQDRFWLRDVEPQPVRTDAASPNYPKGRTDAAGDARAPGLVLFREEGKKRKAFVIAVVVTESPVFGPDMDQLNVALGFAGDLRPGPERKVGILGPTFSGSSRAFADAVKRFVEVQKPTPAVEIVTGSATGGVFVDTSFDSLGPNVTFRRTVATDSVLEGWLCRSLAPPNGGTRPVAVLRELGTGYGAASTEPATDACPSSIYQFPLHIAEVRADHDRAEGSDTSAFPTLRRTLGLKFDPSEDVESDLPSTHSQLTPYEDELSLAQTLGMIRDRGVQFLLIEATDPVDIVFLAQEVRKYCPNVTPVLVEQDEIFVHPDLGSTFSGAIVASTYAPSFGAAEMFDHTDGEPLGPFPNPLAQGAYNAALDLLGATGIAPDARQGLRGFSCAGADGERTCEPQVFLSQIAGSAYWPLAVAIAPLRAPIELEPAQGLCPYGGADRESCSRKTSGPAPEPLSLPGDGVARTLAWLALFVALWHIAGRVAASVPHLAPWRGSLGASMFDCGSALRASAVCAKASEAEEQGRAMTRRRRVWLGLADVSLAAVVTLTSLPFACELLGRDGLAPMSSARAGVAWAVTVVGGLFTWTLVAAGLGFAAAWAVDQPSTSRSSKGACASLLFGLPSRSLVAALLVAPSLLCVCWVGLTLFCHPQTVFEAGDPLHPVAAGHTSLLLYRLLAPLTMSAATPLISLCAGFYLWAISALRRTQRLERFPSSMPSGRNGESATLGAGLSAYGSLNACWNALYGWAVWSRASIAYLILMGFAIWRFVAHFEGTFEGAAYDRTFELAFVGLGLVVSARVVRFLTLARDLLAFLGRLAVEPMVDAYDRLAQKVSGSFGLQMRARVPAAADLVVSVLSGRRLASFWPGSENGALQSEVANVETSFKTVTAHGREDGQPLAGPMVAEERETHAALFRTALVLRKRLEADWQERARKPWIHQVIEDLPREKLLPGGERTAVPTNALFVGARPPGEYLWVRAAEEFVALRHCTFIYQVLHELRDALSGALGASFLMVLSVSVYPFRPPHFLAVVSWSVVVAVVVSGIYCIVAFERDEVLSRLGGTTPNRIEWNAAFVQHIVLYGALPLAAAVVGLFPDLGDWLGTALAPLWRIASVGN